MSLPWRSWPPGLPRPTCGWSAERVLWRLQEAGRLPQGALSVLYSVEQIARLVGQILLQIPAPGGGTQANLAARSASASLVFFYNRPAVLATHL